MNTSRIAARRRLFATAIGLGVALGASPCLAQGAAPAPSDVLAVNLVQLLVKQGVISRTAADLLLKQAEEETAQARAAQQAQAAAPAAPVASSAPSPSSAVATLPPAAAGSVRVAYVPQVVRDQIRDEVKTEVMAQAKAEGWAQPGALPNWLGRIKLSGDLRVRDQFNLYSKNNSNELIDYATFNASGPFDVNPNAAVSNFPFLNTRKDQYNLLSIRARFAVDATVNDQIGAGIRLATGDTNGPVSTTSALGGGFSKKNIWLDRAFVWAKPTDWSELRIGRMANPFFSTDLIYSDDLNFDGFTAKAIAKAPARDLTVSLLGGAFPISYQSQNFPTYATNKSDAKAKWLFAGQATIDWDPGAFDWRLSAAVYDFANNQGLISAPCAIYLGANQCSTDFSIPSFMQKGNTLFEVRNITPNPASPLDYSQPQLLGLQFGFMPVDLTTQFDYRLNTDSHLVLTGEYIRNMAYNTGDVCRHTPLGLPIDNLTPSKLGNTDPCSTPATGDTRAQFRSGPNAWLVKLLYGNPDPTHAGEWNISAGYRYIEPDALLDGFNSSDFHLGGTNAQGYTITTTIGLYNGVYLQARWFSANEVFGPPLAIDVGQLELHLRF